MVDKEEKQEERVERVNDIDNAAVLPANLSTEDLKASARALIDRVKAEAAELVGEARQEEQMREVSFCRSFLKSILPLFQL